jgi:two-component system, NtrC family, nitrogen regulation sensor histidine kinase NtrY
MSDVASLTGQPEAAPPRGRPSLGPGWLGVAYAVAAVVTAVTVYLASLAPGAGALAPATRMLGWAAGLNLILIGLIAAVIGRRVIELLRVRASDPGARLHLRFATLFAAAAVIPAVVVALFFGVLVTRGVDSWFSQRVSSVVENARVVAKRYLQEQEQTIGGEMQAMAIDMNRAAPLLHESPLTYSRILEGQAANRFFQSAYIIDREGRILARAEAPDAPSFMAPPPSEFTKSDNDVVIHAFNRDDLMRALFRLDNYEDAYLYVTRGVQPGVLANLEAASSSLAAYKEAQGNRGRVQGAFVLSYVETVLLVLVGAIWLGLAAANSISAPVARLVQAAGRVASGDLNVRVDSDRDPAEIAVLSHAFNRMTGDLQAQQQALRAANAEATSRRQFIETVLAGVSAGVIGLDQDGRVSAVNRQAQVLLDLPGDVMGKRLAEAAEELAGVAAAVSGPRQEAEQEVDVIRGGDSRRLRVRASATAEGGLVLTFDDITRLVSAQRNAAWRDVARRIAHEIKNPLTPIQLSAERIRRKYRAEIQGDLDTFDRCTDTIIRQVGDIGRMVDEFSSFARMPAPQFGECDAAELLRQAVFAQRVASPDIQVELEEPTASAQLVCDNRMVGQALINVLKNAAEAIQGRQAKDPAPGRIHARLIVEEGRVIFEVEDNGIGLPAKDRDRLTEPYVTTREKGTGLGLAIVKRILEDHGGELILQDAVETPGARAVIRFPRARRVDDPAPTNAVMA